MADLDPALTLLEEHGWLRHSRSPAHRTRRPATLPPLRSPPPPHPQRLRNPPTKPQNARNPHRRRADLRKRRDEDRCTKPPETLTELPALSLGPS